MLRAKLASPQVRRGRGRGNQDERDRNQMQGHFSRCLGKIGAGLSPCPTWQRPRPLTMKTQTKSRSPITELMWPGPRKLSHMRNTCAIRRDRTRANATRARARLPPLLSSTQVLCQVLCYSCAYKRVPATRYMGALQCIGDPPVENFYFCKQSELASIQLELSLRLGPGPPPCPCPSLALAPGAIFLFWVLSTAATTHAPGF